MLTAEQRIKRHIMQSEWGAEVLQEEGVVFDPESGESIDRVYDTLQADWKLQDAAEDCRASGTETGLDCEYSRHYESKAMGRQLSDGSWVGWTYWYGGGKHGDPQSIDWIDEAYDLIVTEEEKLVVCRTFVRADSRSSTKAEEE